MCFNSSLCSFSKNPSALILPRTPLEVPNHSRTHSTVAGDGEVGIADETHLPVAYRKKDHNGGAGELKPDAPETQSQSCRKYIMS